MGPVILKEVSPMLSRPQTELVAIPACAEGTFVDAASALRTVAVPVAGPATIKTYELRSGFAQALPEVYARWRDLYERDPSASLFQHPDYAEIELSCRRDATRTAASAVLMVCETDGVWTSAAVLLPKRVKVLGVVRWLVGTEWAGYRLAGGDWLGDRSAGEPLLKGLAAELPKRGAPCLVVEDLDVRTPLSQRLRTLGDLGYGLVSPTAEQARWRIRFPVEEDPDEYWKQHGSRTRQKFRSERKRMADCTIKRYTAPEQVDEFLAHAHAISKVTWQTHELGLRIRNDAQERAFFSWMAARGAFRSYVMVKGDRPVAFMIGNQSKGWYQYEEVGFDPEFSRKSPGRVLLCHVIDDLLTYDRPRGLDFGGGDAAYKSMFANDESRSGTWWVLPPGLATWYRTRMIAGTRWCGRTVRDALQWLGWHTRLKQLWRARTAAAANDSSSPTATDQPASAESSEPLSTGSPTCENNPKNGERGEFAP